MSADAGGILGTKADSNRVRWPVIQQRLCTQKNHGLNDGSIPAVYTESHKDFCYCWQYFNLLNHKDCSYPNCSIQLNIIFPDSYDQNYKLPTKSYRDAVVAVLVSMSNWQLLLYSEHKTSGLVIVLCVVQYLCLQFWVLTQLNESRMHEWFISSQKSSWLCYVF